jgi:hypothetical protein
LGEAERGKRQAGEVRGKREERPVILKTTSDGTATATARSHWRFEDLEIWKLARDLAVKFHGLAAQFEQRKLYRYAEQLRGAGLSMLTILLKDQGAFIEPSLGSS